MMKKIAVAVSAALGMGVAASAYSSVAIPIDPDGAPGGTPTINVGNLDWSVGNALAVGVGTFGTRFVGQEFNLFAQARLASFNNLANKAINVPQLNSTFEWSYVTGFREKITSIANGGQALQFQVNPGNTGLDTTIGADGSVNFFNIYRSAPNANDLAGRGFNDGSLILQGHILIGNQFGDSGFNVSGNINTSGVFVPTVQVLDQFGSNNYSGAGGSTAHTTITGSGSSKITVVVDSFDAATFKNINVGDIFHLDFNTSQILAYDQTDPSSCFFDGTGDLGGAGQANPNLPTPCLSTIGAVNGVSGPNIMFQTDSNNSFTATLIPEPGVLALLGISLLGLGIARRRQG